MNSKADGCIETLWGDIVTEVRATAAEEPVLASFLHATILNHRDLAAAVSFHLANKLHSDVTPALLLREVFADAFTSDPTIMGSMGCDIVATYQRDSACHNLSTPLLYFKGFHALAAYRVAHWLWHHGRRSLALVLQSRISLVFGVDIHPAARIGKGIMFDHATGIVIGETAVVDDCVSILQAVTLGGTGKETGDRHPKIHRGVLIGPGATILGNIHIGEGSKIAAASVVLTDIPPHSIVAGVPAKVVGTTRENGDPAEKMDQGLEGCGCD
ncbi:MAG: serine O-acetyltransferase [Porticoccaceae bacterium]